jgi:hypothetical protein
MADNGGSGVNAVAIIAIFILVLLVGWFVLNSGMIGGAKSGPKLDVNVSAPAAPSGGGQ